MDYIKEQIKYFTTVAQISATFLIGVAVSMINILVKQNEMDAKALEFSKLHPKDPIVFNKTPLEIYVWCHVIAAFLLIYIIGRMRTRIEELLEELWEQEKSKNQENA